jgi:glycosyltransferase involved in cell wall biosynthesis
MHIAIDARELVGDRTGVGRYLDRVLAEWERLPAFPHRLTMYAHGPVPPRVAQFPAQRRILPGAGGTRWEQLTLAGALHRDRPDVLFAPAYSAPLRCPAPVVLTVHDVSFLAHPEWFRWRERLRRGFVTRAAARRACSILTVSNFSRTEIQRFAGVPAERIHVVPQGLGLADAAAFTARPSPSSTGPLVLFVGSLLNRRHVPELVEAMAIVSRRVSGARLLIVGDNRTWPRQDPAATAARLGIAHVVEVRPFLSDLELHDLYRQASVFAFLSEYEGFGLTPLEALASGVPPVVLDTPTAREVYGPGARFVATVEPTMVADAITELLTSAASREALLAEAPSVLQRYRWADTAAATLAVIEAAARR